MKFSSPFLMEIQYVFVVKESLVVSGTVAEGRIEPGDKVTISDGSQRLNATVIQIKMFAKSLPAAKAGDNAGLIIEGVERSQISPGMHIRLAADSPPEEVTRSDRQKQVSPQPDGDRIEEERVSEEPKYASITCADCHQTFIWNDAFKCTDTPGAAQHTSSQGDYLPRAFCPHCGALIIEWHITKGKDFNTWRWVGQNEELNHGQPFPSDAIVYGWGISIPPGFVPNHNLHSLDVDAIRQSAATSAASSDPDLARAIEMVPEIDPQTADLNTVLFLAAVHGISEAIPVLIRAGASPNFKAPTGWTPLLQAANRGHTESVRALLEAGADPNNQDVFAAHTPLILAAKYGHVDVIKVLLDAGADVNRQNQWGVTALSNASGHEGIEKLLSEARAKEPLNLEYDRLLAELIKIGKTEEFLTVEPKIEFDESKKNMRAREIGLRLNEMGGKKLMQQAYHKIKTDLGAIPARELEFAWDDIGEWLA